MPRFISIRECGLILSLALMQRISESIAQHLARGQLLIQYCSTGGTRDSSDSSLTIQLIQPIQQAWPMISIIDSILALVPMARPSQVMGVFQERVAHRRSTETSTTPRAMASKSAVALAHPAMTILGATLLWASLPMVARPSQETAASQELMAILVFIGISTTPRAMASKAAVALVHPAMTILGATLLWASLPMVARPSQETAASQELMAILVFIGISMNTRIAIN